MRGDNNVQEGTVTAVEQSLGKRRSIVTSTIGNATAGYRILAMRWAVTVGGTWEDDASLNRVSAQQDEPLSS